MLRACLIKIIRRTNYAHCARTRLAIVLMERASLHEALAPCGTLATVAPRTGPDGRAETFAAALERVAAAAAVGARVGSWDVEVAFHLLPDSAAFREVYAVRLEKGGGTTLCGRTGAAAGARVVACGATTAAAVVGAAGVDAPRAAAVFSGSVFACGDFCARVGLLYRNGAARSLVVAVRFAPLSRGGGAAERNFLEACLGLDPAGIRIHAPLASAEVGGGGDDDRPHIRSVLCLVRCFRAVCYGAS